MKLTIDAAPLLVRSAGVKGYLYYWIEALRASANNDVIELFPLLDHLGGLNHEASVAGPWRTRFALLLLHASRKVPIMDLATQGDIYHATILTRLPPKRSRLTATVHDLTCWRLPEVHLPENVAADHAFAERVLKKADGLIAVSEATRHDAIELLGIRPERIVTIHSGIAPPFFEQQNVEAVRARYRLTKPYVLHVGTIEPRKNIDRLLEAWSTLPAEYRAAFDLVFVGPAGWSSAATIARIEKEARWLRYVPEGDMAALTQGASIAAYASLYEGFGFPAAQAMASGVSVLTSNVSSLPEIVGGAALYTDPRSISEISDRLRDLLDSPDLRERLGVEGKRRAQAFRWERCAAESWQFFRRLLG